MEEFEEKINIIPQNIENYLQINEGKHLVFKDSIQFLNSSLAKLAESLDKKEFNHLKHQELAQQENIFLEIGFQIVKN